MTAKKLTAAEKEAAAQKKADEVAAMMGEDDQVSTPAAPKSPPALKETAKPEPEPEPEPSEKVPEVTEDQPQAVEPPESEGTDVVEGSENDVEENAGADENENQDEPEEAKVGHLVILFKTIQTKDKAGNDVKFVASTEPQDLGEYGELAIAAGCAKLHKAG